MSERLTKLREAVQKLEAAEDALRNARDCFKMIKLRNGESRRCNFDFERPCEEYLQLDAQYDFASDAIRVVERILERFESESILNLVRPLASAEGVK